MTVRVPANCSSITFATSGVKAVASRLITGLTAAEETAMAQYSRYDGASKVISSNLVNGDVILQFPPNLLSSVTINAVARLVTQATGVSVAIPAADATAFLGTTQVEPFQIGAG